MSNNQSNLNSTTPFRPQLDALVRMGAIAFGIGVLLCAGGLFGGLVKSTDPETPMRLLFQSYLIGYIFWFGVTAGPVAILLLHNTVGGGWGFVLKRQLTAATQNLPLMALLAVPLIFGFKYLYPWAQSAEEIAKHPVVEFQQKVFGGWMTVPFVIVRLVIYFAVLMLLARAMNNWTWSMTPQNAKDRVNKLTHLGPVGIVLYAIILTFFAVDYVMTLTPGFVSSIIGLLWIVGQGLSSWALFSALSANIAAHREPLRHVPRRYIRDIGNFMLAFTLLWAYMSYGQLVITFSGNTYEEAAYYEVRQQGGWQIVGITLLIAHFALPFLALLSSAVKTDITKLAKLGLIIIFMRFVDLYYWVVPNAQHDNAVNFARLPLYAAMPLAIGGLWVALWAMNMRDKPLIPEADPRLHGAWPLGEHHEPEPIGYEDVEEDALSEAEVS